MKVAIIYDVFGWAYHLRAQSLLRYAPENVEVEIFSAEQIHQISNDTDIVFNLDYANSVRNRIPKEIPLVTSFNCDSRRRHDRFDRVLAESDFVVINNQEAFDFYGRRNRTCCISNGVDTEIFYPESRIEDRPHRVIWCGSTGKGKRYYEILVPLKEIAEKHGFECDFRPIEDFRDPDILPYYAQRAWYAGGSYVVCASESEGTPNYVTEAVACGCVAVSLRVGNIQEWGKELENCVFVDGDSPEHFLVALLIAKPYRELLSAESQQLISSEWSYEKRAPIYFRLFERIVAGDVPKPFSYSDDDWKET